AAGAVVAVYFFGGGFHAQVNAIGCYRRRVSAATHGFREAGDVFGFHGHIFHIGRFHVHVFGGDVFTIEAVHEFSETAQESFRFHRAGVANDDGFATAQVETADGRF